MCEHLNRVGDNYGESCMDCGEIIKGFGYGGWFGHYLTVKTVCIHQWLPVGDDGEEVCPYCEAWRNLKQEQA